MLDCVFDCEIGPDPGSNCKYTQPQDVLIADSFLQGLQSVLRKVYAAEAVLFKRLEASSTAQETERLRFGLTRLGEVERKLNMRIIDHINLISPCDSEEE
ncbi:hypothetical protein RB195_014261 [Necator americanus]|uniref:Uncharacterized protein n=1 Tax=Necator americanus TaxID=51031 RepID=A0ABR1DZA4_NECAM